MGPARYGPGWMEWTVEPRFTVPPASLTRRLAIDLHAVCFMVSFRDYEGPVLLKQAAWRSAG
jgi:hypothetical protein